MLDMAGYKPTDEEIAVVVRKLESTDPENANTEYAREMLIKMKLMYRDIGRIDEDRLHKEMEAFRKEDN